MAKYTKEQLAAMQEQIKIRKEAEAEAYKKSMLEKSAIFRKPIGKLLKITAWIGVILSTIYLVDIFLSPTFTEKKIVSIQEEILDVYSKDGYHVPAKYYWVYFNENKDFGIFMFHGEYELAEESGVIGYGQSPIFGIPTSFQVRNEQFENQKVFEKDYANTRTLPITILIVCLLWAFMNPADNIQFVIYGYFCMFVIPILLTVFLVGIAGNFQDKGLYKMDTKDLRLKNPIEIRN